MFSKRIEVIASKILPYKVFADIGCDHGYLIIEALNKYNLDYAYGVDNKTGPLTSAKNNLIKYNIPEEKYSLSLSNGISSLKDDANCVVIAGMGTDTIKAIINEAIVKVDNINRFIIDSHRNINELRFFMSNLCYKIIDEEIILDEGKFYEIITFEKISEKMEYSDDEIEFGPLLLKEKNDIFICKWKKELDKLYKILEKNKSDSIVNRIRRIERVL